MEGYIFIIYTLNTPDRHDIIEIVLNVAVKTNTKLSWQIANIYADGRLLFCKGTTNTDLMSSNIFMDSL
jgi:xylose isomerase